MLRRGAGGWQSRFYCWWFLVACVCQWRGSWVAWSHAVDVHRFAAPWSAACLTGLLVLKGTRNLITVPYFVQIDVPALTYHFHTRFRKVCIFYIWLIKVYLQDFFDASSVLFILFYVAYILFLIIKIENR